MKRFFIFFTLACMLVATMPVKAEDIGPNGAQITRQQGIVIDMEGNPIGTASVF